MGQHKLLLNPNSLVTAIMEYGNLRAQNMRAILSGSSVEVKDAAQDSCNEQLQKICDMIKAEQLPPPVEQLNQYFRSDLSHRIVAERMGVEEWQTNGKPFTWQLVETQGPHAVYLDSGYGWLALFDNGKLVGCGKETINTADCVVLCKDYYGTPKYIWK